MANEAIYTWGTQKTLEASGASVSNATIAQANDSTYSVASDGSNYPDAEFVLKVQFGTVTSIENTAISLFARPLNIDGTNDAPAPTATYMETHVGDFVVYGSAAATDQYLWLEAFGVPKEAEYYIKNSTGQTITAGWTLKVTPRTYKPA